MMMEGMKLVGIKYDLWLKTNFMPSHLIPTTLLLVGRKLVGIVLVGILLVGKEYGNHIVIFFPRDIYIVALVRCKHII